MTASLRICFTGPPDVGKWQLVETLEDFLVGKIGQDYPVQVLPSAYKNIESLARQNEEDSVDFISLWTSVRRRLWELEHHAQVVLSANCGMTDCAYHFVNLGKRIRSMQSRPHILSSNGDAMPAMHEAPMELTQAIAQILMNQAEQEVELFWDFVYYMPISSSFNPISDEEIERGIVARQLDELVTSDPIFRDKIRTLPPDMEKAKERLFQDEDEWIRRLVTS